MAVISASVAAAPSIRQGGWRNLDWMMLAIVLCLSVWGCLTIASASRPSQDIYAAYSPSPGAHAATSDNASSGASANVLESAESNESSTRTRGAKASNSVRGEATRQAISVVVGIVAIVLVIALDYQLLIYLQSWIYVLNLLFLGSLLVLPRSLAPVINGAKSWIHLGPLTLQPSEFCKVAVIITLAAFLCRRQERIGQGKTVLLSLLYLAPPLLLILKQPDLGTMLSVLLIWFGMLFFGGARWQHLLAVTVVGLALFAAVWQLGGLKPYQKERLSVFLQSDASARSNRGEGWQIKQSQIAIGGGGLNGQGFGQGIQSHSGYMPENTTDFVFTVVAEELGFIGGAALIILYLLLLLRSAHLAMVTDNYFGVLIAGGFTALIAFHCVVNLGMTMRVMPITGVPLPFFSYGGSSLIAFSICVGLLQSITLRGRRNS